MYHILLYTRAINQARATHLKSSNFRKLKHFLVFDENLHFFSQLIYCMLANLTIKHIHEHDAASYAKFDLRFSQFRYILLRYQVKNDER